MPSTYINPITRERATILETSAQTGGSHTLIEVELQPGGGNPIHFHKQFTEDFYPVHGVLGVHYKGTELRITPGDSFKVPILEPHRFYNPMETPIIFRARLEPGQPGFENFMAVLFGLVRDGRTFSANQIPYNPLHAALLFHWGDTYVDSMAFKIALPLVNLLAKLARKLNIDKKLLARYQG
jgi:mannose-6-phosphate isomerase-like protein (cupin superfamily)